jgi:hypothetical protein
MVKQFILMYSLTYQLPGYSSLMENNDITHSSFFKIYEMIKDELDFF